MIERSADSAAPAAVLWDLMARPGRWHEWAPHLRGDWGLTGGDGLVRQGAFGAARLLGVVPVPVVVTDVQPYRSWTWRAAGLLRMEHRVEALAGGGSRATVTLDGPLVVRATVCAAYAPLVGLLVKNLARVAGDDPGSAAA